MPLHRHAKPSPRRERDEECTPCCSYDALSGSMLSVLRVVSSLSTPVVDHSASCVVVDLSASCHLRDRADRANRLQH